MSLDDRDWYREAMRERDLKQKRKVVSFNKRSKQYSRKGSKLDSAINSKADGLIIVFFVLFWVIKYAASYFVSFPSTVGLIAINILIFILINTHKLSVQQMGLSSTYIDINKQWYRIFSSAFTHENILHITMNMYSLYNIGAVLEKMLGSNLFTLVYFLIGITGGLLSYLIHKRFHPNALCIGASGILCGLLGVYVVIAYQFAGVNAIRSVASSMVILVLMAFSKHIDSIGHFSGLGCGIGIGMLIVKLFYPGI